MKKFALLLALLLCLTSCGTAPDPSGQPDAPSSGGQTVPDTPPVLSLEGGPEDHTVGTAETPLRRWYGAYTDHLIPSPDYGPLYAFIGQDFDFPYYEAYTFGLMTGDGTVVVDSVYVSVEQMSVFQGLIEEKLPVLWLSHVPESWDGKWVDSEYEAYIPTVHTAAALDGSWVIEGWYESCWVVGPEAFCLLDGQGTWHTFNTRGEEIASFVLPPEFRFYGNWTDGIGLAVKGEEEPSAHCLVNAAAGTVVPLPGVTDTGGCTWGDTLLPARQQDGLWGCLDITEDHSGGIRWAIQPAYSRIDDYKDGYTLAERAGGEAVVLDRTGTELFSCPGEVSRSLLEVCRMNGRTFLLIRVLDQWYNGTWYVFDEEGNTLEILPADADVILSEERAYGLVRYTDNTLRWLDEEETFPFPAEYGNPEITAEGTLLGWEGENRLQMDRYGNVLEAIPEARRYDETTGRYYYLEYEQMGQTGSTALYDGDHQLIAELRNDWESWYAGVQGGLFQCRDGMTNVIYNLDGEVLLRYPLRAFVGVST